MTDPTTTTPHASIKRPALLAEDGATFHAHLEPVPDGQVQATCRAQIDYKSSIEVEAPEYLLCHNRQEARAWVHRMAGSRGFKSILWDDESSAKQ